LYKFIFKIALTSLSLCGFYFGNASAQNYCQVLGQKLSNKYSNGSISTLTYFNYSLLGIQDHFQRTEYKFDYSDYSKSLKDCSYTNYGNGDERVKLRLTRVTPIAIDQYNNPVHNLTFEIDMRLKKLVSYAGASYYVNSWHVNSVSSQNCEEIITTSFITKYKNDFEQENRVVPSDFNDLIRHMVFTHVCNAHYFSLKNIFNDVIKG
jgi:hypothetical protein